MLTIGCRPLIMELMSVAGHPSRSNACIGLPVDFYWYGGGASTADQHITLAVDALMGAIKAPPNRLWNPFQERMIHAEFKKRLEKAARGELEPPAELKPLRGGDSLFEIRWQAIPVHEVLPSGRPSHTEVGVRLIHAQPFDELGLCILGLHAHEKTIIEDDHAATKDAQDHQIDIAEQLFASGYPTCWGVTRRA